MGIPSLVVGYILEVIGIGLIFQGRPVPRRYDDAQCDNQGVNEAHNLYMAKRKAEYIEGRKAREKFEDAMRYAFQIPKEKAPAKLKPKRRRKTGSDAG